MKLRKTAVVQHGAPSRSSNYAAPGFLNSLTRFLALQTKRPLSLALLLLLPVSAVTSGQQTGTRSISFPVPIQWTKQKGVAKYRLQVASDESFRSIFFDGRVQGDRYTVTGLPPGYYYWRMAPADSSTGRFSTPVRFFVSGGAVVSATVSNKAASRPHGRSAANSH